MEALVARSGLAICVAFIAVMTIIASADFGFSVHLAIVAAASLAVLYFGLRNADYDAIFRSVPASGNQSLYDDDPIRWGVLATLFWGFAGFAAGIFTLARAWRRLGLTVQPRASQHTVWAQRLREHLSYRGKTPHL